MMRYVASVALAAVVSMLGCGDSANISEASCSACAGRVFTESDCEAFATLSGCASSSLEPGGALPGCTNSCKFTECDSPPECAPVAIADASSDVPQDPRCMDDDDGLFADCELCPDSCGMLMINGATQRYCQCAPGSCPCGYECGSISLPTGGAVSSACSPP